MKHVFEKSKLETNILRQVFRIVNTNQTNQLNRTQFIIGLHLLFMIKEKVIQCPNKLPDLYHSILNPVQSNDSSQHI